MPATHELRERVLAACLPITDEEHLDGTLRRSVKLIPEFSCRNGCVHGSDRCRGPGSPGYHGLCSRRLQFGVSVEGRGGVSLCLFTPIYTEDADSDLWTPLGPLDFHWADPGPEYLHDLGWAHESCAYTGGRCWSDVTYLQAEAGVEALLRGGVTGVWSWLAEAHLPTIFKETP